MPINGTLNQMRDYLTDGFWADFGNQSRRSFDISSSGSSGVIKYNVTGHSFDSNGLTAPRANLVRDAFKYLENVTGIDFQETTATSGNGAIYFQDTQSGAWANSYNISNGHIGYSKVNIDPNWYGGSNLSNNYVTQTILHEVGHALGLGHQGDYNGSASYPNDAKFTMDSWQNSIMSYFDQTENTAINASYAFVQSMMSVDLLALDKLYGAQSSTGHTYGTPQAFTGNTVYGFNTNISSSADPYLSKIATNGNYNAYTITDGGGTDTFDFSGWSANQNINLTPSNANATRPTVSDIGGKIGNLTLAVGTIIENARGGSGNDTITGNAANNYIVGNSGNDRIFGRDGNDSLVGGNGRDLIYGENGNDKIYGQNDNDTLHGQNGRDLIYGQAGNDVLNGGAGIDALDGGPGIDTAIYTYSRAGVNANLSNGKAWSSDPNSDTYAETSNGNIALKNIENLTGSKYNDIFVGNTGNNTLRGGSGNDTLYGQSGNDGLYGDAGNDILYGQGGSDVIKGGVGADSLEGGPGRDFMYAGVDGNRDVFVFKSISDSGLSSTSRDVIYEFDSGEDDINLSVIDANTSAGGNQAFAFSTNGAAAHSVWVKDTGSNLVVYGDVNGNTTADFSIEVVNINTLLANDFIL